MTPATLTRSTTYSIRSNETGTNRWHCTVFSPMLHLYDASKNHECCTDHADVRLHVDTNSPALGTAKLKRPYLTWWHEWAPEALGPRAFRRGRNSLSASVNLDRLLKLRLAVGRFGEMDAARWWNTTGMLGPRGATVLARGFPATHYFAQGRVVFAVAQARCEEVFRPPGGGITLWDLPAELEDQFEEYWHVCLDEAGEWTSLFETLARFDGTDLKAALLDSALVSPAQSNAAGRLRRSADGRAVRVPAVDEVDDELIALLAAAFALGEPSRLAVPYANPGQAT